MVSGSLLMAVGVIHIGSHERQTLGPVLAYSCDSTPIAESGYVRSILRGAGHLTSVT